MWIAYKAIYRKPYTTGPGPIYKWLTKFGAKKRMKHELCIRIEQWKRINGAWIENQEFNQKSLLQ